MPYTAPRRSLPATTSASSTPGAGFSTNEIKYFSRLPFSSATSILPALASALSVGPSNVPAIITRFPAGAASTGASVPPTRPKSAARLAAAIRTAEFSPSATTMAAGAPFSMRVKRSAARWSDVMPLWSMAAAANEPAAQRASKNRRSFFMDLHRWFIICKVTKHAAKVLRAM